MDITFTCDKCGGNLVVDEAGAGITIDCPVCGNPVYVPTPVSESPVDPPAQVVPKTAAPKPTVAKTPQVSTPKATPPPSDRRTVWSLPPVVKKYNTLRTIASLCQFMAVPAGIFYAVAANWALNFYAPLLGEYRFVPVVVLIFVGVLSVIGLLAAAESIRMFIDIEENTRAMRQMMEEESVSKHRMASPSVPVSATPTRNPNSSSTTSGVVRF
jgi:hypothetical protein